MIVLEGKPKDEQLIILPAPPLLTGTTGATMGEVQGTDTMHMLR